MAAATCGRRTDAQSIGEGLGNNSGLLRAYLEDPGHFNGTGMLWLVWIGGSGGAMYFWRQSIAAARRGESTGTYWSFHMD
jgi:hypothetical protein